MLKQERLEKLGSYIRQHRYVGIQELADSFGVSRATVRRDLDTLCQKPEFCLTRGGVTFSQRETGSELPYDEKRNENREEKMSICKAACDLVQAGATIILDTGTTTREMTQFLKTRENLYIATNDLIIAAELTQNPNIEVNVTGGKLRQGYYTLRGRATDDFLKQLHVDILFLSLDAVDCEFGGAVLNMDEVMVKQRMMKAASRVIVLCDHTKFESKAFLKVCDLKQVDLFITGKMLNPEIKRRLEEKGAKLMLV